MLKRPTYRRIQGTSLSKSRTANTFKVLFFLLLSILVPLFICYYILAVEAGSLFEVSLGSFFARRFLAIWIPCIVLAYGFTFHFKTWSTFIFKYRWTIACSVFILCVVFEISGSSISELAIASGGESDVVFGKSRFVRSDEWAVFTPMAFSQVTSDNGLFSYFQDTTRGVETDMFMVYGQPVNDIAILLRPFQIGYLFLGASRGLSFFWCGRMIFLFMVSFEFGYRVIYIRAKSLALGYALLIAFAPLVQWWFSINGLVEMLLFGQLALIWANYYLKTNSYKKRVLLMLGITWSLGVFVFAVYPSWELPLAYIFIAVLISLLLRDLSGAAKGYKDIILCMSSLILLIVAILYVLVFKSADTISQVSNSVYPGQRTATGGNGFFILATYPLTLFYPICENVITPNACEASTVFSAFPLIYFLAIIQIVRSTKARKELIPLLVVSILLICYGSFQLPDWLTKITLLDKVGGQRSIQICSFSLLLLLFFSLKYIEKQSNFKAEGIAIVSWLIAVGAYSLCANEDVQFVYVAISFGITLAFMIAVMFSYSIAGRLILCSICALVAFLSGALVNPINVGIEGLIQAELVNDIAENNEEGDLWASIDNPYTLENAGIVSGARTINSINTYPQLETWKKVDPDGSSTEIYNRYSHIPMSLLSDGDPQFDLLFLDSFSLDLSADSLSELGVNKIFSSNHELTKYSTASTKIEPIDTEGDYFIYELIPE